MADDIKKACDICELSTKRSDPEQKLSITDWKMWVTSNKSRDGFIIACIWLQYTEFSSLWNRWNCNEHECPTKVQNGYWTINMMYRIFDRIFSLPLNCVHQCKQSSSIGVLVVLLCRVSLLFFVCFVLW
jgi:hypothetical protein